MAFWTFSIVVSILICIPNIRCNECIINVKDDMLADSPTVAFLFSQKNPSTTTHAIYDSKYLYPSDSWNQPGSAKDPKLLILQNGANVHFICQPQTHNNKHVKKQKGVMTVNKISCDCYVKQAECIGNNKFRISVNGNDKDVEFKDVKCAFLPKRSYAAVLRDTKRECEDMRPGSTSNTDSANIRLYEIFYDLGNDRKLNTIELCHDTDTSNTLWSHSFVIPENQDRIRYTPNDEKKESNSFKDGDLFKFLNWEKPEPKNEDSDKEVQDRKKKGKDSEPYSRMGEWKTARFLLGNSTAADKYFCTVSSTNTDETMKYLARGHLIADGDKFYKSEQDSTYFYANALPMWQSINAIPGYWYTVELRIRQQAAKREHKFLIWSGGIDILNLTNKDGDDVEFFLDPFKNNANNGPSTPKRIKRINMMPVPKVIFKIVVDEDAQEAIVFLVVNHPDMDPTGVDEVSVCPDYDKTLDPCRQPGGLIKDTNERKHGHVYCCQLSKFYDKHADHLHLKNRLKDYTSYSLLNLK